eukprot:s1265_g13.t1
MCDWRQGLPGAAGQLVFAQVSSYEVVPGVWALQRRREGKDGLIIDNINLRSCYFGALSLAQTIRQGKGRGRGKGRGSYPEGKAGGKSRNAEDYIFNRKLEQKLVACHFCNANNIEGIHKCQSCFKWLVGWTDGRIATEVCRLERAAKATNGIFALDKIDFEKQPQGQRVSDRVKADQRRAGRSNFGNVRDAATTHAGRKPLDVTRRQSWHIMPDCFFGLVDFGKRQWKEQYHNINGLDHSHEEEATASDVAQFPLARSREHTQGREGVHRDFDPFARREKGKGKGGKRPAFQQVVDGNGSVMDTGPAAEPANEPDPVLLPSVPIVHEEYIEVNGMPHTRQTLADGTVNYIPWSLELFFIFRPPLKLRAAGGVVYRKGGKGKGKDKEGKNAAKGDTAASPSAPLTKPLPPWPSLEGANSMTQTGTNASSSTLARDQEAVRLLKQAYPDAAQMPQESKDFIERVEKETVRTVTKSLHSTTTAMDKAHKTLTDALEAKKAHRQRWANHLTEAVNVWRGQLQDYRQQQAAFQEVITKARVDVETYRSTIQGLTSKTSPQALAAATPPIVPCEVEDLTSDGDGEEEKKIEEQMQSVLRTCLVSLGVNIQVPAPPTPTEVIPMEEEGPDN